MTTHGNAYSLISSCVDGVCGMGSLYKTSHGRILLSKDSPETCRLEKHVVAARSCLGLEVAVALVSQLWAATRSGAAPSSRLGCSFPPAIGGQVKLRASRKLDRPSAHFV